MPKVKIAVSALRRALVAAMAAALLLFLALGDS